MNGDVPVSKETNTSLKFPSLSPQELPQLRRRACRGANPGAHALGAACPEAEHLAQQGALLVRQVPGGGARVRHAAPRPRWRGPSAAGANRRHAIDAERQERILRSANGVFLIASE